MESVQINYGDYIYCSHPNSIMERGKGAGLTYQMEIVFWLWMEKEIQKLVACVNSKLS